MIPYNIGELKLGEFSGIVIGDLKIKKRQRL
jgi:hypothetical protein